jgi:hypothetical protein
LGVLGGRLDLRGQEAAAQRRVRHEADAEFARGGQDFLFHHPLEDRVLGLHHGDRLYGVGAPDAVGPRLAEPEVADLARVDQFLDGAGHVFDRHVGVDPVLV